MSQPPMAAIQYKKWHRGLAGQGRALPTAPVSSSLFSMQIKPAKIIHCRCVRLA